jgi:endonuclease/exonuclease/phosphatase family metal-dependent hydrolase
VATYNVRNYLEVNRWVDGKYRSEFPKPEIEKQAMRKLLLEVRPDVLVLQEMGVGPYLSELQSDLREEGLDLPFKYVAVGSDDDRHVALLSRLEPVEISTHTDLLFDYIDETLPVKRGMMEVVFQTQGLKWKVFGLHLKSKWSDFEEDPTSDDRRRSEALACRKRILELQQSDGLPFLILGDLNDSKLTPPVRLLQSRGKSEVATAVDAFDSRGERWTYYYSNEETYSRIDYILKSPDFPAGLKGGQGWIYDGPAALEASDHRLVWVDLDWGVGE